MRLELLGDSQCERPASSSSSNSLFSLCLQAVLALWPTDPSASSPSSPPSATTIASHTFDGDERAAAWRYVREAAASLLKRAAANGASELAPFNALTASEHRGALAVGICGLVSVVSTALALGYIAVAVPAHWRLPPATRVDHARQDAGIRFLTSQFGALFCNLAAGCFVQALGYTLALDFARRGGYDYPPGSTCLSQGVLIIAGNLLAAFSTLLIGVHTASILVFSFRPSNYLLFAAVAFIWLVAFLLSGIGFATIDDQRGPWIAWATTYCFIAAPYVNSRIWIQWVESFFAAGMNLLLYLVVVVKIWRDTVVDASFEPVRRSWTRQRVAFTMLLYPLLYILTVLPLLALRIRALTNQSSNDVAIAACTCLGALYGFTAVVAYASTRKFISLPATRRSSEYSPRTTTNGPSSATSQTAAATGGSGQHQQHQQRSVVFPFKSPFGSGSRRGSAADEKLFAQGVPINVELPTDAALVHGSRRGSPHDMSIASNTLGLAAGAGAGGPPAGLASKRPSVQFSEPPATTSDNSLPLNTSLLSAPATRPHGRSSLTLSQSDSSSDEEEEPQPSDEMTRESV